MARLAVPYELYGILKQRRAIGKQETDRERRLLYQAYLDTLAGRKTESERTAMTREYQRNLIDLQKEAISREEAANRIRGLTNIGELGFEGYKALKGTSLGAKLGIGPVKEATAIGTKTAATATGAQTQALSAPAGKALIAGQVSEPLGEGVAAATAGGTTTAGTSGLMSTVVQPAGLGLAAGGVASMLPIPSEASMALGGLGGAVLGFAAGGPVGGIIGAISGIFGGGGCIIITACTDTHSPEVKIAREYRDKYLSQETLRGYYSIAESLVPSMIINPEFKHFVKKHLVDHFIAYGKYKLGYSKKMPWRSALITKAFLKICNLHGKSLPYYIRCNGEVW